jgi:hypothetical protein
VNTSDTVANKSLWWTAAGASASIASLFLEPVRAFFKLIGQGIGSGVAWGWNWTWTVHKVPGVVLFPLVICTVVIAVRATAWFLRRERVTEDDGGSGGLAVDLNPTAFKVRLEGVLWDGTMTAQGSVANLLPFCPHCSLEIRPSYYQESFTWKWVTRFQCEDCKQVDQKMDGKPRDVFNTIARRIEARRRRGELG